MNLLKRTKVGQVVLTLDTWSSRCWDEVARIAADLQRSVAGVMADLHAGQSVEALGHTYKVEAL